MFEELKTKAMETKSKAEAKIRSKKDDLKAWGIVGAIGAGVFGLGALIGAAKGYDVGMDAGCRGTEAAFALFEPDAYGRVTERAEALGKLLK